jgi:hypothetical protein
MVNKEHLDLGSYMNVLIAGIVQQQWTRLFIASLLQGMH